MFPTSYHMHILNSFFSTDVLLTRSFLTFSSFLVLFTRSESEAFVHVVFTSSVRVSSSHRGSAAARDNRSNSSSQEHRGANVHLSYKFPKTIIAVRRLCRNRTRFTVEKQNLEKDENNKSRVFPSQTRVPLFPHKAILLVSLLFD